MIVTDMKYQKWLELLYALREFLTPSSSKTEWKIKKRNLCKALEIYDKED